jgi:hypothetical protein
MRSRQSALTLPLLLCGGLLLTGCNGDENPGWVRDGGPNADAAPTSETSTSGKTLSFVKLELDRAHAGRHAQIARSGDKMGIAYLRQATDAVQEADPDRYTVECPSGGEPQSSTAHDVYYMGHDGSDWATTPVLAAEVPIFGVPRGMSLALDTAGNPYIGHLGGDLGSFVCLSSDGMITSSSDQGATFRSRVLWGGGGYGSGDTAGHWMSLAFDCDGNLQAALRDFGSGGFETELTERAMWMYGAGEAITTEMTPNGLAGNGEGEYNKLVFDTDCKPVIMSYDSSPAALMIAVKEGTNWTVTEAVRTATREQPGFATDGNGTFGLAYYTEGDRSLRLIESTDLEGWSSPEIVDLSTSWHGTYASLAYDSQGNPAVSYYRCATSPGAADCQPGEDALMFAYRRGGVWKTWQIDTGDEWFCGRYTSLLFTADDRPYIAYECTARDNINDTFPSVLKVAEGEWK